MTPRPPTPAAPAAIAADAPDVVASWRERLRASRQALRAAFAVDPDSRRLLHDHTALVDDAIRSVWRASAMPTTLAAVAVGGYGRRQLYPHSDVDVLVLLPDDADLPTAAIERFFTALWDIGIELSHAVRTLADCETEMARDVATRTSLLDHRLIVGSRALLRRFRQRFAAALDVEAFHAAKVREQQQRHLKYQDAVYNLEPNVKESPGGLRDLATVLWIAQAAGFGSSWRELARNGLMTQDEARGVARAERLIAELRIRLHFLLGRREDRLIFDAQHALAAELHLADTRSRRASEQLMQRYYRAAKLVLQVNTILLANLHARLHPAATAPVAIDADFQQVDELLDARSDDLFARRPAAILDAFLLLQTHSHLTGMTARTVRAIWAERQRIDAAFRADPANRERFIAMFRTERGLLHGLRRMNLYGVLGRYLPVFGRIVGQMQHDLFHVYTVDEHILMVIRNLRRFTEPQHAHEYPLCSRLITDFDRRWVLYIAGLFHDIAKGRGGDHSILGARDARRFCREHGLAAADAALVEWLVAEHLVMSATAQKQDLSDPEVIHAFARRVGTERRLAALYLLTVADIRGTSPTVWNSWKGKLLEELYHATHDVLAGDTPERTIRDSVETRRDEARHLLHAAGVPEGAETALWRYLDTPYFQRHTAEELAWHARQLFACVDSAAPIVKARLAHDGADLQVLVYTRDEPQLFARLCGFFGHRGLSILEAKIHTTRSGFALDTFTLNDPSAEGPSAADGVARIESELTRQLIERLPLTRPVPGRGSRRVRHFPLTPQIQIFPDDKATHFILEITAADRPGLLARIAYTLAQAGVNVASAKINTLGDRAEDVFLVDGAPLHDEQALLRLETALYDDLAVGAGESG